MVNADTTTKEHSERLVPAIGKVKARLTGRARMRHLVVKSVLFISLKTFSVFWYYF